MNVFISSTFSDLQDYRNRAVETVNQYKCQVLAMEFFGAQPEKPQAVCEKEIAECDIFIGLYAHRYGFVPEGETKSITQLEYELARKLGKDCLCFIVDKKQAWLPELMEWEKAKELQEFLKKVKDELTTTSFTTPPDFGHKLATSLGKLLQNKQQGDAEEKPSGHPTRFIPLAPTPFLAHPYPLPEGFTGREAEKARLSHWLHNAPEPVMVMEAIGGMGKSALTWVWLQEEILAKNTDLDGVLWWSFYDEPFESFLAQLFHYLTSREVVVEPGAPVDQLSTLCSILYNNRFLLILDGFERALRGYSGMSAMYRQEAGLPGMPQATEEDREKRLREPVHPQAARFLQSLGSSHTKTLLTTRLFPAPLEGLAGVEHAQLKGLSRNDTVHFFVREGIGGNRRQMDRAGEIYGRHPLMLKLLSTAIKRSRLQDIESAFTADLIHRQEPQKILGTSFQLLTQDEQKIISQLSVFRGTITFAAAQSLLSDWGEDALWNQLNDLRRLGFLFYDQAEDCFDFHPILRSFLYDGLTDKNAAHERAIEYFQALPEKEKVVTLEDLAPVIELFHHLTGLGKFDEACEIYRDRLSSTLYYQLANYSLIIELLQALFPDGEDRPSALTKEADQAWILNTLANAYTLSGQPGKAVPLYLLQNKLREKAAEHKNLAIGLGNVAQIAQLYLCQLSAAALHLQKNIALCQQIGDEIWEASGHKDLGHILAYQGCWHSGGEPYKQRTRGSSTAEEAFKTAFELDQKSDHFQGLGLTSANRALSFLWQARLAQVSPQQKKTAEKLSLQALEQARTALEFAEKQAETDYPVPRDFIRSYWLMGETLILSGQANSSQSGNKFEIHFYDEHFQALSHSLTVSPGEENQAAERCLDEACRRCRETNLVEMEANILLAQARLVWAKTTLAARVNSQDEMTALLQEAHQVAERADYRLQLADIHLFCGEVLLNVGQQVSGPPLELLGLPARVHVQKAKAYALDVSEFADVYQSDDPEFYADMPEYAMLKRGLTDQERIDHGYWVAWQLADALEQRLDDLD